MEEKLVCNLFLANPDVYLLAISQLFTNNMVDELSISVNQFVCETFQSLFFFPPGLELSPTFFFSMVR